MISALIFVGEKTLIVSTPLSSIAQFVCDENQASTFCSLSLIPAKRMRPFFTPSAPNLRILSLKLCTLNKPTQFCAMPFEFVKIEYFNSNFKANLNPNSTLKLFNFGRGRETTLNCETTLPPPQLSQLTCTPFRLAIILERPVIAFLCKS